MKALRSFGLENDIDRGIVLMNVSLYIEDRKPDIGSYVWKRKSYLAHSFKALVAFGAFSFWTSRMFRGEDFHCSDSRSFDGVSTSLSSLIDVVIGVTYLDTGDVFDLRVRLRA